MPPDTTAVTVGSAHCGGKWEGCANMSPINVAIANRADRRLSSGAIDCPVHLCKKGNRNH